MLTAQQRTQLLDCCRELVWAESMSGQEQTAAATAERWMNLLGYDDVLVDPYGSVVGRVVGTAGSGPNLHFDGHLDTVPATAREHWQHDPFAADIADEGIWGRGTADMKGPLAAMICAAGFVPRNWLHGTITVSASVAEEQLEGPALCEILQTQPADLVVIGEGTNLLVGVGQKGRAGIRVTTTGTPAHSSVPHKGDNAVYRMLTVINRLREFVPPDDELLGAGIMELVEMISSPYPGTSIVPDRCTVRWDRRLVRGETRESVLADLRAALADLPGADAGRIRVDYLDVTVPCYTGNALHSDDFHPAWEIEPHSPLVQAALHSTAALGLESQMCAIPYCTNGSGSAGEMGLPTIVLGPGDPAQFHVIDEHILIEDLVRGAEVYSDMAQRLLAGAAT